MHWEKPRQWRTDWVLIFNSAHAHQITKVCSRMQQEGIHSVVFAQPKAMKNAIFVMLMLKDSATLMRQAARTGHKMRMCHDNHAADFSEACPWVYEPFTEKDAMVVTREVLEGCFDLSQYQKNRIILQSFPTHKSNYVQLLQRAWCEGAHIPFTADLEDYIYERESNKFEAVSLLATYFGEQYAIYYGFNATYTAWMTLAAVPGFLIFFWCVYLAVSWEPPQDSFVNGTATFAAGSTGEIQLRLEHALATEATPIYCVFMTVWTVIFVEVWKRKQSEIVYGWDMLHFSPDDLSARNEFQGDEQTSLVTGQCEKAFPEEVRTKRQVIGYPILALCCAFVVGIVWQIEMYKAGFGDSITYEHKITAGLILGVSVFVLGVFYHQLATWLNDWENYRTMSEYDSQLATKLFLFQYFNNYTAVYYAVIVHQNIENALILTVNIYLTLKARVFAWSTVMRRQFACSGGGYGGAGRPSVVTRESVRRIHHSALMEEGRAQCNRLRSSDQSGARSLAHAAAGLLRAHESAAGALLAHGHAVVAQEPQQDCFKSDAGGQCSPSYPHAHGRCRGEAGSEIPACFFSVSWVGCHTQEKGLNDAIFNIIRISRTAQMSRQERRARPGAVMPLDAAGDIKGPAATKGEAKASSPTQGPAVMGSLHNSNVWSFYCTSNELIVEKDALLDTLNNHWLLADDAPGIGLTDKYVSLMIQLGFVCMWTPIWPLMPFISMFYNMFQMRGDVEKVRAVSPISRCRSVALRQLIEFLRWCAVVSVDGRSSLCRFPLARPRPSPADWCRWAPRTLGRGWA